MAEAGFVAEFFNRLGPDAAGRAVDNPFEGKVIVRLQNNPEIGQSVADFGTFIKLESADNLVGYGFVDKLFFKFAGLGGGTYQNRHVGIIIAAAGQAVYLVDDILRLFGAVISADDFDFAVVALQGRRIFRDFQSFAEAVLIVADKVGGGFENIGG